VCRLRRRGTEVFIGTGMGWGPRIRLVVLGVCTGGVRCRVESGDGLRREPVVARDFKGGVDGGDGAGCVAEEPEDGQGKGG